MKHASIVHNVVAEEGIRQSKDPSLNQSFLLATIPNASFSFGYVWW